MIQIISLCVSRRTSKAIKTLVALCPPSFNSQETYLLSPMVIPNAILLLYDMSQAPWPLQELLPTVRPAVQEGTSSSYGLK